MAEKGFQMCIQVDFVILGICEFVQAGAVIDVGVLEFEFNVVNFVQFEETHW